MKNFDELLCKELARYIALKGMSNITFSQLYKCSPNYVSQMRTGVKKVNVNKFAAICLNAGDQFIIDFTKDSIQF